MKHVRFLAWTLTLSAMLLAGCSDDDNTNTTGPPVKTGIFPAEVLGTWQYKSVTVDGSSVNLSVVLDWVSTAVSAQIVFIDDGDYSYSEFDASGNEVWSELGTVAVTGNNVVVHATQDNDGTLDETYTGTYSLSDGGATLIISAVIEGFAIVFTLQ